MATVTELTKQLVGNGYKQPSANDIRKAHRGKSRLVVNPAGRKNFVGKNMGIVRSQFDAVSSAPVDAGDIAKSAITAERLAGVAHDSKTDVGLQRIYGNEKSKPTKAPVESPEFIERNFEPTAKLDKPNRALNLEETNRLYAKRRRA